MLKVMIVEDEQPILNLMKMVIDQNKHLSIVGCFNNPLEALNELQLLKPDVAFLDIEMPRMTGLELAKKILQVDEDIQIVFTTAYERYALEAFKVSAIDYILKPVTPEEIERVTKRLMKNHRRLFINKERSPQKQEESILCLGTLEMRGSENSIIKWPTRKTEELFAYFLIHSNQVISKWELTQLLWGEMEDHRAIHNLHTTIYRLKKTLKENSKNVTLEKVNEGYILNMSTIKSDLDMFLEYFNNNSIVSKENFVESERVFNLFKGPLFGLKDYLWKIGIEEQLVEHYSTLTQNIANFYNRRGKLKAVEKTLKAFLSLYPLHDQSNLILLKLYSLTDDLNRLKSHYDFYVKLLKKELGVTPPIETQKFIQQFI
ncbi:response regulator [Chengkuizengella marina]|uniref:response regulator n=1 Tax=Chengkuizengella marina TaxID=2507566 RepID=UPI00136BB1D4|nr:response regulator [Chengkuizengella marina]